MKPTTAYEIKSEKDLGKFLLRAIQDVANNEMRVDKANVISKIADKYIKFEILGILKTKVASDGGVLNVDGEINRALMQNMGDNE